MPTLKCRAEECARELVGKLFGNFEIQIAHNTLTYLQLANSADAILLPCGLAFLLTHRAKPTKSVRIQFLATRGMFSPALFPPRCAPSRITRGLCRAKKYPLLPYAPSLAVLSQEKISPWWDASAPNAPHPVDAWNPIGKQPLPAGIGGCDVSYAFWFCCILRFLRPCGPPL